MKRIVYWDNERGKQVVPRDHIKHITANEKKNLWCIDIQEGAETYTAQIHLKPKDFKRVKSHFNMWVSSDREDGKFNFCDYQDLDKERKNPANAAALTLFLNHLEQSARKPSEKGRLFEFVTLAYLQSEPKWKKQFRQVRTFEDWAKAHPDLAGKSYAEHYTKDLGIDLVADNVEDGKFAAIQCKFYARYNKLPPKLLATFLGESSRDHFTRRILVCTNEITSVQHERFATYTPPIEIVDRWILENAEVHWNSLLNICLEQEGKEPPFSVKPENVWKKNLSDSVEQASKEYCDYFDEVEPGLSMLQFYGILSNYDYWEDDDKGQHIVLIPHGGLSSYVLHHPVSLREIAEKIRCQWYMNVDRNPYTIAYGLLDFSTGKGKGLHGETHKEMTNAIWEVAEMWNNIATMLCTYENAFKEIDDKMPELEQYRCLEAYKTFKEAEAEFKQHEEEFNKCCRDLNEKYRVNNLDEEKKYLS